MTHNPDYFYKEYDIEESTMMSLMNFTQYNKEYISEYAEYSPIRRCKIYNRDTYYNDD